STSETTAPRSSRRATSSRTQSKNDSGTTACPQQRRREAVLSAFKTTTDSRSLPPSALLSLPRAAALETNGFARGSSDGDAAAVPATRRLVASERAYWRLDRFALR